MTPPTKTLLLVSLALILLLLAAGCLDDLSSTLPPCCDGTCGGVKTSVIERRDAQFPESSVTYYTIDSDGILYGWGFPDSKYKEIIPHYGHNVTFSYEMANGQRHITGIIEDHDAKPARGCECVQKCCGCDE